MTSESFSAVHEVFSKAYPVPKERTVHRLVENCRVVARLQEGGGHFRDLLYIVTNRNKKSYFYRYCCHRSLQLLLLRARFK
jgi:hypothetical protein